ncbi:MAG: glycosyltransferase family 39 protein, partial [Acidobacteria bacterium]|nr:glycosyltransferase family 39 protein [Acidobacteriota bacterium]
MPATRNSKRSRISKRATSAPRSSRGAGALVAALLLAAVVSICAAAWVHAQGYTLYYGDAESHLAHARRIIDSRTPGPDQLGTPWLPLPHLLMLPFVGNDGLWRTGLAGVIPTAGCFVAAAVFLFAALREIFDSVAAAFAGLLLLLSNPNLLYLQSTPMNEPVFLGGFMALLYFTARFRRTQSVWSVAGAGFASAAASLTRYDGWFVVPFVTAYFFIVSRRRWRDAALFGAIAGSVAVAWLAHNWYYTGNALEFYNGPYSHRGIYQRALDQGMARYAGDHEWGKAWLYFREAARLCAGTPLYWMGALGLAAALLKRALWPAVFVALPIIFYVISMYSSGTPIFLPHLWPQSYYNTRYGLAAMPLLVLGGAALVAWAPGKLRAPAAAAAVLIAAAPWIFYPRAESWITWKESQVNSETRRTWTRETADFLRANRKP